MHGGRRGLFCSDCFGVKSRAVTDWSGSFHPAKPAVGGEVAIYNTPTRDGGKNVQRGHALTRSS